MRLRGILWRLRAASAVVPDERDEAAEVLDGVEQRLAAGVERNPIARAFLSGGVTTLQAMNRGGRRP